MSRGSWLKDDSFGNFSLTLPTLASAGPFLEIKTQYGCFLKWWYPKNTPKWSFSVGKPMVVGYHNFRKPWYGTVKCEEASSSCIKIKWSWININPMPPETCIRRTYTSVSYVRPCMALKTHTWNMCKTCWHTVDYSLQSFSLLHKATWYGSSMPCSSPMDGGWRCFLSF